jgi:hypothetical protein
LLFSLATLGQLYSVCPCAFFFVVGFSVFFLNTDARI